MSLKDRHDSFWESVSLPKYQSLKRNLSTDVCVVGGGISGVAIAYELSQRGHKVCLVEAYRLGSGQTSRTTAHLSYQLEEEFSELMKMHSKETIATFIDSHRRAIEIIEETVSSEQIDCDFKRVDGYLFQGTHTSETNLKEEQKAAKDCGLDLTFHEKTPLLDDPLASLKFSDQAQFHPLKYMKGLLKALKRNGVSVFENTKVSEINSEEQKSLIKTEDGYEIEAKYLVIATDSPINNRLQIHNKQFAYRTYSVAFEVLDKNLPEVLLWDTEDPYHYIRFAQGSLIVGAEDHRTGQAPSSDPFENLEKWSREKFSFLGKVISQWSGQIFEPADQIGYIGKNPGKAQNVYVATGYSGLGMTSATIASVLISDLIEDRPNLWASIYDPNRVPLRNAKEYVKENINVALQYRDWFTPSDVTNENEIPEDTGCLVRDGLTKNCIYHESGDHFERSSAVCPHLGGIVHWNDIEKTWDCPAHGSRFNTKGKVIEGPSLNHLAGKE